MKDNRYIVITILFSFAVTLQTSALLSNSLSLQDEGRLLSAKPDTEGEVASTASLLMSSSSIEDQDMLMMAGSNVIDPFNFTVFDYVYDVAVSNALNLSTEVGMFSDAVSLDLKYAPSVSELEQTLNTQMVSIFNRYVQETSLPIKDPFWLLALCAVELGNFSTSDGLIFTLPVDMHKATQNTQYLLEYNWKDVADSFGLDLVLSRDGSSIGPLQLTGGFANNVNPIIPEEFGVFGATSDANRRTDAWVTLGACLDTGTSIIWKSGIDGDRWSPADMANITYGVYNTTLKNSPTCLDDYNGKYEQAIILMWGHNRGTGIINNDSYKSRTKALASCVLELQEFLAEHKPNRFSRTLTLMPKIQEIADRTTDGDLYPVMGLVSYLIMEARFNGQW